MRKSGDAVECKSRKFYYMGHIREIHQMTKPHLMTNLLARHRFSAGGCWAILILYQSRSCAVSPKMLQNKKTHPNDQNDFDQRKQNLPKIWQKRRNWSESET